MLLRKDIRLGLPGIVRSALSVALLDKHSALSVLYDMPRLMIKRKPKMVISLASKAQLNQCF